MKPLPEHGPCFVCGTENSHSIGIRWFTKEDGAIHGTIILTEKQQGPPKLAHGGATAALLDEAMGAAVWLVGHKVVAVNLDVDFLQPVPLGEEIEAVGRVTDIESKTIQTRGEIRLQNGTVAVTARGTYVEAPQLFKTHLEQYRKK